MQSDSYLLTVKRHWQKIFAITVLITATTLIFGYTYLKNIYTTTIFINIGVLQNQQQTANNQANILDNIQAADQFSETVMGWFKNPNLLKRVEQESQNQVQPAARKQEKQNLIVTFNTNNEESAPKITQAIQNNLNKDIGSYNSRTNSQFQLTLFNAETEKTETHPLVLGLFGLILGLILGTIFSRIYEKLFQK